MRIFATALLAMLLWAPAQAQSLKTIEFKPSAEKPIAKIAILTVRASQNVKVYNQNAAGTTFGILPALIYGLDIDKKGAEYSAEMNKRKMTLAPELANLLHKELSRKYKIVLLRQTAKLKEDKTPDYSSVQTDADAILNVFYGQVGYLSPHNDTDYLPVLIFGARLLDAQSKETIYYRQFAYWPKGQKASEVFYRIDSDERYRFGNYEALMAGFERSIEGLLLGQGQLVEQLARDLGVPDKKEEQQALEAEKEKEKKDDE